MSEKLKQTILNQTGEEWRDIKDFEGLYQISNYGRIKSFHKHTNNKTNILSPCVDSSGYYQIKLSKNKKKYHKLINRLVAEAFIENPLNLPEVNHKDENKLNNYVENLEWCTRNYNINYGTRTSRMTQKLSGTNSSSARKVMCVETQEIFDTINDAAYKYHTYNANICKCCRGKRKTTAGYHWEYIN